MGKANRNKDLKPKEIIINITITTLVVLCIVAAYNIIIPLLDYTKSSRAYLGIAELALKHSLPSQQSEVDIGEVSPPAFENDDTKDDEDFTVDFTYLETLSAEIAAWIYIPDTAVNYPVMHRGDNEYYLKHLYNGKYNSVGSIFIDTSNNPDFTDDNTILHGHNMKNGSMFSALLSFRQQSFYDKHSEIYIFTPSQNYIVKVISAYTTKSDSESYRTAFSSEQFNVFIDEIKQLSDFDSTVEVSRNDKLITLSTCTTTGTYTDYRYIVHGVISKAK